MRHQKGNPHLNKPWDQRVALVRGQLTALFQHGYINTTMARAKAVQPLAEKVITRARRGSLHDIRQIMKFIYPPLLETKLKAKSKKWAGKIPANPLHNLLYKIVPNLPEDKKSGFTAITKLKFRRGDGSLIVRLYIISKDGEVVGLTESNDDSLLK